MSGERTPDQEADRRRRLEKVFGDALPEQTRDDASDSWDERRPEGRGAGDDWLRSQVPPHHG